MSILSVFVFSLACGVGSLPVHCDTGLLASSHGQPLYWMCLCSIWSLPVMLGVFQFTVTQGCMPRHMGSLFTECVHVVCVQVKVCSRCGESPNPLLFRAECIITWAASLLNMSLLSVFRLKSARDVGNPPIHCNPGQLASSHGQPLYWMCLCSIWSLPVMLGVFQFTVTRGCRPRHMGSLFTECVCVVCVLVKVCSWCGAFPNPL